MRLILLALTLLVSLAARSETVAVPELQQRVTDTTHTLSAQARSSLTQTLAKFEQDTGHQLAVLLVGTTGDETIEQYATRVFDSWKLGDKKRDDGLLLVVATADHTLRIEVGYGLEGVVTDLQASQVINRSIVPYFKQGDVEGGIQAGVEKLIQIATSPASDAETGAAQSYDDTGSSGIGFFGWLFGMPFLPLLIFRKFGKFKRCLFSSLVMAALTLVSGGNFGTVMFVFLTSMMVYLFILAFLGGFRPGGGGGSSRHGGGGFGSSGGGFSSGGGGGFSGGGGSSGGGGASGRW